MKKKLFIFLSILLMISVSGCGNIYVDNWYDHRICMHALGIDKDGNLGFNSLEALDYSYKQGQRLFETDIQITTDNVAVLRHDWSMDLGQAQAFGWSEGNTFPVSYDQFMSATYESGNKPSSLLSLYKEMSKKKDLYIIIDPKYSDDVVSQFTTIVNTAIDGGYEDVLKRIIVQLYYEDMYDEVESVYHFDNYLFTLYLVGYYDGERIGAFCQSHDIPVVTIPTYAFSPDVANTMARYGIKVYVHTINDVVKAQETIVIDGAHGVYSDSILNKDYFGK